MDMFVVPTISFRLLYGFLILRHSRREILWLGVTAHPSAQWIAVNSPRPTAGNRRNVGELIARATSVTQKRAARRPKTGPLINSKRATRG